MISPEKRKKIEDLILGTVQRMETGTENYERYSALFKSMDDEEFSKWASGFKKGKLDQCIQIFALPFQEPTLKNIKAAADFLDIPLEEYIYYKAPDGTRVRSKVKVPVGFVAIKRLQQILSKKNKYTFDADDVSLTTGQVKGDSKAAAVNDSEAYCLVAISADKVLEEFLGFRADNAQAKNQAYRQIARDGFCTLSELESEKNSSQAINTVNANLLASGIYTDLVSNSLKTRYTIEQDLKNKK